MIDDLVAVLIQHQSQVRTNTPLEVLAAHMVQSLNAFEQTLLDRSNHPFFAPGKRNDPNCCSRATSPPTVPAVGQAGSIRRYRGRYLWGWLENRF